MVHADAKKPEEDAMSNKLRFLPLHAKHLGRLCTRDPLRILDLNLCRPAAVEAAGGTDPPVGAIQYGEC